MSAFSCSRGEPLWLFMAVALLFPAATPAEEGNATVEAEPDPERIRDPYDTTAPVGAVRRFIDAARANDWPLAAAQLNLDGVAAEDGPELARQFKTVLDRAFWIDYDLISDRRSGDLDDGLPPGLERIGAIDAADVLLERMPARGGERHWKFSSGTVRQIKTLYAALGYSPLEQLLPDWMFDARVLEMQLWQWTGLVVLVVAAWLLSWVIVWLLHLVLRPIVARSRTAVDDRLLTLIDRPARFLTGLGLFLVGSLFLALSVRAADTLLATVKALAVVGVTWLALRVVDFIAHFARDKLEQSENKTALAIVPLGRRAVKVALVAIASIGVLQNLGFQVTGLIAGLGVGGLALALAAQKTIENLFGGVSLIADQPVHVGDFCRFGDQVGTVEEIGLRSTRIRTLDRTRITVPNSQFSEIHLESFAARDRVRLLTTIGVRYETTSDQMRYLLTELRRVLVSHPMVVESPVRVRFIGFGAYSLDIEITTYVTTTDWNEFLAVREDLFLRFMDAVGRSGTGFAFPSQTLYMTRDGGLDEARSKASEAQVQRWRDLKELPFPNFSDEALAEMRDSVEWPPEGSPGARIQRGPGGDES